MNKYTATVIKTGNSYALRVPKKYVEDAHLESGQKAVITLPVPEPKQNRARVQEIIRKLQETKVYQSIKNPVAWQRENRKDRQMPGR